MNEVTRIINAIQDGDEHATEELLPLVYEELRLLAAQKMSRERPGQTLQATALVHEAYLRLIGSGGEKWDGRGHFFAAAAEAMRRILIENARRKGSPKHGGDKLRVELSDTVIATNVCPGELIELNEALGRLEKEDSEVGELVKLRYFIGLTIEDAAGIMGISERTAYRYWAYARARLQQELSGR